MIDRGFDAVMMSDRLCLVYSELFGAKINFAKASHQGASRTLPPPIQNKYCAFELRLVQPLFKTATFVMDGREYRACF